MIKDAKQKQINRTMEISMMMYCYLHYFMYIWLVDLVNLICLFTGLQQSEVASHIIALVLVGLLIVFDKRYYKFSKYKLNIIDILVIIFLVILGLYKCIYPDTNHDSLTYHITSQEPYWPERDTFYYAISSFPFADRLLYLFRIILGFRMGTLGNVVVLYVIYLQLRKLLETLLGKSGIEITERKIILLGSIGCFFTILLEGVLMELGTYLTDLIAIPLMLEVICKIIHKVDFEEEVSAFEMFNVAIMLGFIFLCKFISAIVVVVLLVAYLFLIRKSLNVKNFLCSLVGAVVVVTPFLIYNYYYFGVILHQISFLGRYSSSGAVDTRWGGENLLQKFLWPIYMAEYPSERHMEIIDMPNYFPIVAICIVLLEIMRKKKQDTPKVGIILFLITTASFYLWAFSGGVDRYAFINLFLYGVIIVYYLIIYLKKSYKIPVVLLSSVLLVQCIGSLYCVMINNNNWQWAPSVLKQVVQGSEAYKEQIEWFGQDRGELIEDGEKYTVFVYPEKPGPAIGTLINDKADVYTIGLADRITEEHRKEVIDQYNEVFDEKAVYTICDKAKIADYVELLNQFNLYIEDVELYSDTYIGAFYVLQVSPNAVEDNRYIEFGVENITDLGKCLGGEEYQFEATLYISPYVTWTQEELEVTICYEYEGEEIIAERRKIKPGEIYVIDTGINLDYVSDSESIDLYAKVSGNYGLEWSATHLINPELCAK